MLRGHEALLTLALVAFVYRIAHDALPSVFVLYGDYRFGWDARTVGFALAIVGVTSIVVQAGLVGPMVERLGEPRALFTGLVCGALAFTAYGLAPNGFVFLMAIPLGALYGLVYASLQGLVAQWFGAVEPGRVDGALGGLL